MGGEEERKGPEWGQFCLSQSSEPVSVCLHSGFRLRSCLTTSFLS